MTRDDTTRLREILATMDLPAMRVSSLDKGWLLRNIAVRNSEHPEVDEALRLLKKL